MSGKKKGGGEGERRWAAAADKKRAVERVVSKFVCKEGEGGGANLVEVKGEGANLKLLAICERSGKRRGGGGGGGGR